MSNVGKRKNLLDLLQTDNSETGGGDPSVDIILKALDNDFAKSRESWNIKKMLNALNEALYVALKAEKNDQVTIVCDQTIKLLNTEPERFIEALGKPIEAGAFRGENSVYFWMDQLYSAVLVAQEEAPIVNILVVLRNIFKKAPEEFCRFLMSPVSENNAEVSNGLLLFTRILAHISQLAYKYPSRFLIADFFNECVMSSPHVIGLGLFGEMAGGSFKGKSPLYMVVDALKKAAVDDPFLVNLICDIIIDLKQKHHEPLLKTLGKISESGPYEGKCSLHTILTTLISSAYIKNKPEIADKLINMLQVLWERNTERMGALLTKPIETGEAVGQNGVLMLVRALTAMLDNQMDPALLVPFLDHLFSVHPDGLAQALIQKAPDTRRAYNNVSALQQLLYFMPHQTWVRALVENLASSSAASQLIGSLSEPQRTLFLEVFSAKHNLSQKEMALLLKLLPDEPVTGAAGEHDLNVGDLISRIRAGAYPNSFFSAAVPDEPPIEKQHVTHLTNK
ncbi:hypothetical protein [Legionella shakespearei]|uniref:Uncharacterized protein n=1 Tax=Legionella shakespearei DSM 23087 TaxID=1122169 RepID=A0A0W0YKZ2_9GAMM|nr:hypothetical protein [Legionella shakespearei]KTD57538.1 hypothetical protein Lsha_2379 [Legionella shakespearei DSM 23087]